MLHDLIKQATKNLEPEANTAEDWFGFGKPADYDEVEECDCEDAEFTELEEEDEYEECDCEDDDDDEYDDEDED
jgi:hypothetical protein